MKTLLHRWRGLQLAAAIAATIFAAQGAPEVQTLGGGPNQSGPGRAGANNGATLNVAKFNKPSAVAIDTNGNLYIADRANNKIRKVTNPGSGDSLTSTFASRLPAPTGVAVDASNQVYVVTQGDGKLRVYNSSGSLLRTVAGLRKPSGIVLGSGGNVYVVELVGNVKQIAPDNTVTLISSGFLKPQGIALLPNGLLAVSDTGHNAIYTVNPADGTTTLVAGNNGAGFSDGPGATAQFKNPAGLGATPNGAVVIADRGNHRVRVLNASNEVSTLYGVPRSQWVAPFPGWVDGTGGIDGTAAAHDPVGVAVARDGTVFATEIYWNLLRQVTGTGLAATNGTGNATNVIVVGTNVVTVVGTNVISFGFESGEASSSFVGAAGQMFYAPVTLANAPGQKIYTFQMSLSVTGETGLAINNNSNRFEPMVDKQDKVILRDESIPFDLPQVFTTNILYVPIPNNIVFRNDSINMLGVGWLTRYEKTNLYNTLAQDLITYSIAKDTLLGSAHGKVVLGAYGVLIPMNATDSDTFLIAISNPSGTADGIIQPVPLTVPTNGSLGAGAPNAIKRITIGSRPYLVGDSTPFRWLNAGDFGDTNLADSDVVNVFTAAAYGLNRPAKDSDLFDAMDSSDGSSMTDVADFSIGDSFYTADQINAITMGDGALNLDDVFVTFRRALDPTLKWYARYWTNGARQAVEVANTLFGGAGSKSLLVNSKSTSAKSIVRPELPVAVDDALVAPNATLHLPIRVQVSDPYVLRTLLLNLTVEALDGSPAITDNISLQMAPSFGDPDLSDSRRANNFAGAWLDNQIAGISGNAVLAILTVHIPASAGPGAAYRVHFDHFSASPNGTALFETRTRSGLVLLSDRSASTWGDGIADAWRLRYFGSISAPESAANADADADGLSNSEEYINGTDPTNPLSN